MSAGGNLFGIDFTTIFTVIVILLVALALERIFTNYISKLAKRARLERNVANNVVLTFRILILIGAGITLTRVGGLDPQWIVAISTIAGAALGFASQKTLGNFLAGLFLLVARPFKVGDYVRLGTVEGVVQEITINYTKVLTIGNSTVSVSNLQILDRDITNYTSESRRHYSLYYYSFDMGFNHEVSSEKMAKIFNEVFERHMHMLPRRPSYMLKSSDAFNRIYTIFLPMEHPEDGFALRPQVSEEIFNRWDIEREALKGQNSASKEQKQAQEMSKRKKQEDEE